MECSKSLPFLHACWLITPSLIIGVICLLLEEFYLPDIAFFFFIVHFREFVTALIYCSFILDDFFVSLAWHKKKKRKEYKTTTLEKYELK